MKCCDLTAGQLRTPVSFQRKETVPGPGGGVVTDWVEYQNVRAKVVPMSGGEKLHAQRLDATGMARLYRRYRADIVESDRVVIDGRPHQIRSIVNVEMRNRWLEILIERGVAQ